MNFAVFEKLRMNTTTIEFVRAVPSKEVIRYYHVRSVFNEAPEGTGREEAIQHLAMSGYHLQPGQEIAGEAGWPPEVLRQVRSRPIRPELATVMASSMCLLCAQTRTTQAHSRRFQPTLNG
jgi:hypothetical protein